jgi:TusA-related sulfurtransferase
MPDQSAPDALLLALTARDFEQFAECLAPSAQARMLLPRGPEVRSGREDISQRFEGWFARASDFEVLDTRQEQFGHRNRLSWRFRLSRDGQTHEVIEQLAFVDAGPDGISQIDLLCSGFMQDEKQVAQHVLDAGAMGCADGLAQEFRKRLAQINIGESLAVTVSDPAAKEDLPSLARMLGQTVKSIEAQEDRRLVITVEKRK